MRSARDKWLSDFRRGIGTKESTVYGKFKQDAVAQVVERGYAVHLEGAVFEVARCQVRGCGSGC